MAATSFAAVLAATSFGSESTALRSFESMLRRVPKTPQPLLASDAQQDKHTIHFNSQLFSKFIEMARLYFYAGELGQTRVRCWFMLLVVALFLGVISLSFLFLSLLVASLTYFEYEELVDVAGKGLESSLKSREAAIIASVVVCLALSAAGACRRQIRGKMKQWGMLAGILFMMLLLTRVVVLFSYISREIENTLHEKREDSYYKVIMSYGLLLVCVLPITAADKFTKEKLSRNWRQYLTELLVRQYMAHKTYYRLDSNSVDTEIDNPDQRMTEDAEFFTEESLSFLLDILKSIMNLVAFAGVLWSISPQLMAVLVCYTSVISSMAILMGKRLIQINYEQLRREADLRYSVIRVRENAESIAFYDGEQLEMDGIFNRFNLVLEVFDRFIRWDTGVETLTRSFFYLSRLMPYLAIAPLYFQGKVQFGTIAQAQIAFFMVLNSVDFIIRRIGSISKFAAGVRRLSEFYEAITIIEGVEASAQADLNAVSSKTSLAGQKAADESGRMELSERSMEEGTAQMPLREHPCEPLALNARTVDSSVHLHACNKPPRITSIVTDNGSVDISRMTLLTPTGRTLVRNLTIRPSSKSRILVVGPSGTGKSSLLRAIAGLWNNGTGKLSRPPLKDMMFLPQKPYMPLGNLRAQLIYPRRNSDVSDEELTQALRRFNLGDLPSRFSDGYDSIQDWSRVLSLGEQQRVAAARCLLSSSQLRIVVLDEATSALPVPDEKVLYGLLKDLGVGLISVGHRDSLVQHHDLILRLHGGGGWELLQPSQYIQGADEIPTK